MFGSIGWQELLIVLVIFIPHIGLPLILLAMDSGKRYPDSFVDRAFPDGPYATATSVRRWAGNALDGFIFLFTLGIGWIIWLAIVAPRGQSPGKALVGTYIIDQRGQVAGAALVWGRELLLKLVVPWVIAVFIAGFGWLLFPIAGVRILWDPDKQCLWDKVTHTFVGVDLARYGVRPPQAPARPTSPTTADDPRDPIEQLRQLRGLLDTGAITEDEYQAQRAKWVTRL